MPLADKLENLTALDGVPIYREVMASVVDAQYPHLWVMDDGRVFLCVDSVTMTPWNADQPIQDQIAGEREGQAK